MSRSDKNGWLRLAGIAMFATPIVLGFPRSSEAVLITHNSVPIFFDDFESAPEVETDLTPGTLDANPVAVTGTWVFDPDPTHGIRSIQVTNDAADHGAAAQGNNFLYLRPNTTDATRPAVVADFGTVTGGLLHFETMYRNNDPIATTLGTGGTSEIQFTLRDASDAFQFPTFRGDTAGNFIVFNTGFASQDTGFDVPQDGDWHKVVIDYNLTTGGYSFSLDDGTPFSSNSGITNAVVSSMKIGPAGFTTDNESQTFDLDAVVPEPASFGLLAAGALLAMRRRRS